MRPGACIRFASFRQSVGRAKDKAQGMEHWYSKLTFPKLKRNCHLTVYNTFGQLNTRVNFLWRFLVLECIQSMLIQFDELINQSIATIYICRLILLSANLCFPVFQVSSCLFLDDRWSSEHEFTEAGVHKDATRIRGAPRRAVPWQSWQKLPSS